MRLICSAVPLALLLMFASGDAAASGPNEISLPDGSYEMTSDDPDTPPEIIIIGDQEFEYNGRDYYPPYAAPGGYPSSTTNYGSQTVRRVIHHFDDGTWRSDLHVGPPPEAIVHGVDTGTWQPAL